VKHSICVAAVVVFGGWSGATFGSQNLSHSAWHLVNIVTQSWKIYRSSHDDQIGFDQPPRGQQSRFNDVADMFVFGNSTCGAFIGSAHQVGSHLRIFGLEPDPIRCTHRDLVDEKFYLKLLRRARTFHIDESGKLDITDLGGTTHLIFESLKH
jgi:hypothetical protein